MNEVLTAERVTDVFTACMSGVTVDGNGGLRDAVTVQGVKHTAVFSRTALQAHTAEIAAMLAELPQDFLPADRGGGGGWSFLNFCDDRHGQQWTGFHLTAEKLLLLGLATDQADWCLPDRELWPVFPGGMPYVVVHPVVTE